MTRYETQTILKVLKAGYQNFYKGLTKPEAEEIIDLWATMFAGDDARIVTEAVKTLMCILKYPPTIADVKEKIELLTAPVQMTEMEAWHKVQNAMDPYRYVEKYNELPPLLKRLVGKASQLREWAISESDISVLQSNLMRSYRVMAAQEREINRLPESSKQLMKQLAGETIKAID
jgi:hypothetical protein